MKSILSKTNLIHLIAALMSLVFAIGVLTYSWYFQGTETEDVLRLEASGAQIIMFEAGVSEAALTGTLYPARAKEQSYLDGTIPDNPQVIPINEQLPDCIDTPAGIVTYDTNLTYYDAIGQSGKVRVQVFSSAKIKGEENSRDLQVSNEVQVEYFFQLQDFNISIGDDAVWHILNTSFPNYSTIYKREGKKFYEKPENYTPLTGDRILYNQFTTPSEYGSYDNEHITKSGADVYVYDYQIAYIRNGKKYLHDFSSYTHASGDQIIFVNKKDSSIVGNQVENVLLTNDLVFYTREGKNHIEKFSVYNSGSGNTALKTGDIIQHINVNSASSPISNVYLGPLLDPKYVEYYIGSNPSKRYVVSKDYYENNLASDSQYHKVTQTAITTSGLLFAGITFDDSFVVFQRDYSGTRYTCVDHVASYSPETGDSILYFTQSNSEKVEQIGSSHFAKTVDIRVSASIGDTVRDLIYIDDDNKVRWALSSDAGLLKLSDNNLLFAKIVDKGAGKIMEKVYIVYDTEPGEEDIPLLTATSPCLILNGVSFNDTYTLVDREFLIEAYYFDDPEDIREFSQYIYSVEKSNLYSPKTNDYICFNKYIDEEILYNSIKELYFINNLDLMDDDVVYSRDDTKYIVKFEDYEAEPDDNLLFYDGRAVCRGMLKMNNSGFSVDNVALQDTDTAYLRNGRVYVANTTYYNNSNPQNEDVILFYNGTITEAGADYVKDDVPEDAIVDYYIDNVYLMPNDNVYCRDKCFRFIYKDGETYVPQEYDEMFYDSGYMVVDAQTRFLVSVTVYIMTLDQETSRDLIGATLSIMLSMDSPDIN